VQDEYSWGVVMNIRQPAVAGAFYPDDEEELRMTVQDFLQRVPEQEVAKPMALIVPHAGYVYSGQVAAYAFALLQKYPRKNIIILGPSHAVPITDVVGDTHDAWLTPLGQVRLLDYTGKKTEIAHANEHCLEVQVPFLQETLEDFKILPLIAGGIDPEKISAVVQPFLDKDTLLLISSDLSHYHDYESAVRLDNHTINCIMNLDYKGAQNCEACGIIPILTAISIARRRNWSCHLLNKANSGDVTGDRSHVVGYASLAFT
jgi:hypothetical protein